MCRNCKHDEQFHYLFRPHGENGAAYPWCQICNAGCTFAPKTFYREERTIQFNHQTPYHAQIDGEFLTITNGQDYDAREKVTLALDDQLALLSLIADRLGLKVEGL